MKTNINNRLTAGLLAFTFVLGSLAVAVQSAQAAPLTNTYVRTSRMAAGQTASVRLVFRTGSVGATSVSIAFNGADSTTWTGSSGVVNATQTASSATCAADTGSTALPGTLAASGAAGTISITGVTALATTTSYCVDLTSVTAVTNPTAGEYHPVVTAGADSTTIALRSVSNDQVVVTATVAPTFNFALSANSDTFTTNLAAGSVVSTSGVTATVNTNAKTGWIAWANGSVASGLVSAAAGKTIASTTPGTTATLTPGSEGYVFGVTSIAQGSGAGTTTASTAYNATATGGVNTNGSGLDATYRPIASSTGTASTAALTLKARASISALTPAASDYTDTITLIAAGSF